MDLRQWFKDNLFRVILFLIVLFSELVLLSRDFFLDNLNNIRFYVSLPLMILSVFGIISTKSQTLQRYQKVVVGLCSAIGLGGSATYFFYWYQFIDQVIQKVGDVLLYPPLLFIFVCTSIYVFLK
jgi:hypothetical protein